MTLADDVVGQLLPFSSEKRLYELELVAASDGTDENGQARFGDSGLLVEAFCAVDGLHEVGARDVIVLSTSAHIELKTLIGLQARLLVSLSDGSRTRFSGLIQQVSQLGSEGGLARYRLRLVPWLWLLSQVRTSRVWQDKSVVQIIESVLGSYPHHASWIWSPDVAAFMADAPPRSYCIQYRESDLDFVERLLAEEGLTWRVQEADDAVQGHQVVFLADTTQPSACPPDYTSEHALGGHGIRFHGGRAREEQDSIQYLRSQRSLQSSVVTLLSYDYKAKQSVTASVPTAHKFGGERAPVLESYDSPGLYAYPNRAQAQRYATQHMQASEARNKRWYAHSTVRTLRSGTQFDLTQGPLGQGGDGAPPKYTVLRVTSVGINNLPKRSQESLRELFGALPELLGESLRSLLGLTADTIAGVQQVTLNRAVELGYANEFEAIRADVPWRPILADGTGARPHPRATALGSQTAIVVGAQGQSTPQGADELHCDKLGRVRIRFHWQENTQATCWVRVAQRAAGGGHGLHFLPRIGQEVLVQFLEGDIDRPIILGALYNGQGEGGIAPTPAGASAGGSGKGDGSSLVTTALGVASAALAVADLASNVFQDASDHIPSAQGNLVGANAPSWHGLSGEAAEAGGQRNAGAQWGMRSKEFGGTGYNQLLIDDTDQQNRIQLKTTAYATELNLGHLIHSADNYRGSFRGHGWELRSDAYGAVRSGTGLLISSYPLIHTADSRESAGDNTALLAKLKLAGMTQNCFGDFAAKNGVPAAGNLGGAQSQGFHATANEHVTQSSNAQFDPHSESNKPSLNISAKAGLGVVAGQALQFSNGEQLKLTSGQDSQYITGRQLRVHAAQSIALLSGVGKPGANGLGMQVIAAKNPVDVQAQTGTLNVQAKGQVSVISANEHIDWAAAKSIKLSTAGGANITIEGGNITVQCPGKITIHASQKTFEGGASANYPLPHLPKVELAPTDLEFRLVDPWGRAVPGAAYKATLSDGSVRTGKLDADGYARISGVPVGTTAHVEYLRDERPHESEVSIRVDQDWDHFMSIAASPSSSASDA